MEIRRVVTGHNPQGESCVMIDDNAANATSRRPGHDSRLIWHTDSSPAKFMGTRDEGAASVGRPPPPNGSIFRLVQQGTKHNWINRGTEPCRFAVVLIDGDRSLTDDAPGQP